MNHFRLKTSDPQIIKFAEGVEEELERLFRQHLSILNDCFIICVLADGDLRRIDCFSFPRVNHPKYWLKHAGVRCKKACKVMDISPRTYQRWTQGSVKIDGRGNAQRPEPSNKLTQEERDNIL